MLLRLRWGVPTAGCGVSHRAWSLLAIARRIGRLCHAFAMLEVTKA